MSKGISTKFAHSILLSNFRSTKLVLVLEPWAEYFDILPDDKIEVTGHGPKDGVLDVAIRDDEVSVAAWRGGTLVVRRNGVVLGGPRDAPWR